LLQLFMLFSFFIDGLAYAAEALAGKYVGAGDNKGLGTLVRSLTAAGLVCALVFAAAYFGAGEWFMGLLAKDPGVVATAATYLPWAVAVPLCGFAAFVFDGIFVGLVRPGAMLVSMVAATAVFFAIYYVIEPSAGNHGLWLAFNTYLLMRGIVEILLWIRLRKAKGRGENP
ncbi:MAG: MATE family efflux transporter, partial [Muribaculaceae bacterium]|nr:MATE family efflux transporter [Muribaculaceae bacterium]